MDLVRKEGDHTTVLFLAKVKLMGWEQDQRLPPILRQTDVEVVLGSGEVVLRSREGLDNFEEYQGPNIEICGSDTEDNLEDKSIVQGTCSILMLISLFSRWWRTASPLRAS